MKQRGITLIEALIALLVSTAGLLALATVQAQVSQAVAGSAHLSQAQHQLKRAVDATAAGRARPAPQAVGLDLDLSVTRETDPVLGDVVDGTARWTDAHGRPHRLSLSRVVASADESLALQTLLPSVPESLPRPPGWPVGVRALSDGRAVFSPNPQGRTAWVLDPATGRLLAICALSTPLPAGSGAVPLAALQACAPPPASAQWLLSGYIEVSGPAQSRLALDPTNPGSPNLQFTLASGERTLCPVTAVAAAPGSLVYRYHCLVPGDGWSGQTTVTDWPIGTEGVRVCRFSRDDNGNGTLEPSEHPSSYQNVLGGLVHQNFLVISGGESCPNTPAQPTQPHQPSA